MKALLGVAGAFVLAVTGLGSVYTPIAAMGKANQGGAEDINYELTLSALLGPGTWDGSLTYTIFDPGDLESWLSGKVPGSPLRGSMADLVGACEQHDVNPAVALGVAGRESSWETAGNTSDNNPFGLKPGGSCMSFSSYAEAYDKFCSNLKAWYIDKHFPGLAEISAKYSNAHDTNGKPHNVSTDGWEYPYSIEADWADIDEATRALVNNGWLHDADNGVWTTAEAVYRFCGISLDADAAEAAAYLLASPKVSMNERARQDLEEGIIEARVLNCLVFIVESGYSIEICCLRRYHSLHVGHNPAGNISNHSYGCAADLSAVNGVPLTGQCADESSPAYRVCELIMTQMGEAAPGQVACSDLWSPAPASAGVQYLPLANHRDHIHIGYRPTEASILYDDPRYGAD